MNAIIQIDKKLAHNKELAFLSQNLLDIKICGKKVLSYYFDFLNEVNIKKIFILSSSISRESIEPFYLSEAFPVDLEFYEDQNIEEFYENNLELLKIEDLICIKNIGFIFNSFSNIKENLKNKKENFIIKDDTFEIKYIKKHLDSNIIFYKEDFLDIKIIKKLEDYIYILNKVLSEVQNIDYIHGYSNEEGIIIGKNVSLPPNCKLVAPLIILDNVNISKNCILGPNTIISNDVVIDKNTSVVNSIVYDNTYIGTNLDLENKLAISNEIIDKSSLEKFLIDEKFIGKNEMFLIK